MILLIVGALFVLMGLFSGAVLVVGTLGWIALAPSATLWLLFPLFSILGYGLFAMGARVMHSMRMSFVVGCLLLVLALLSAMGLVLEASGVSAAVHGTLTLWYVLAIAGLLGALGVARPGASASVEVASH